MCSKLSGTGQRQRFKARVKNHSVHVFIKSDLSVFEMMLSHNRVSLLSCINRSLTWIIISSHLSPVTLEVVGAPQMTL